jgi:hypothetical protein
MKIDLHFPSLVSAERTMGASHLDWLSPLETLAAPDFMVQLGREGIEIELDEIEASKDGLLTYMGQKVMLYIKDTRQDKHTLLNDPSSSRRFHVADKCKTLENMRADNRYDRYVVTTRMDGLFMVDAMSMNDGTVDEIEAPLKVCKNCLKALDYKGYANTGYAGQKTIWSQFVIDTFFDEFTTKFRKIPKFTDRTYPPSQYTNDWDNVSEHSRKAANWTCSGCGVVLAEHRHLLHVHHINGVKGDNSTHNLEVLCSQCHQTKPGHQHMYVSAFDRKTIRQEIALQGL